MQAGNKTDAVRKLRFGVMCNTHELMAFQAECLRHLTGSSLAELKLVITPANLAELAPSTQPSAWKRAAADLDGLVFRLHSGLANKASAAKRVVDMRIDFSSADALACHVSLKGKYSQYFNSQDLDKIRSYDLDFILRFGFGIIRGDILSTARYGVWSFHTDDERKYRGGPPAYWEIYHRDPVTGAILQRLTDKLDAGIVLYRGSFPTIFHSWRRNFDHAFFASAEWPLRVCHDILNGCADYISAEPSSTAAPIYVRPTNCQALTLMLRTSFSFLRKQLRELIVREQWHVGIVKAPIHELAKTGLAPEGKGQVEWLPGLPHTRFIADPFAIKRGDEITIFVEDLDQIRKKGRIAATQSADGGRTFSPLTPLTGGVFDEPVHKAYPYVFEHSGEIFCVPETCEKKEISLYRAAVFPYSWQRVCSLMEGVAAVDPTIFRHDGYWWLFYGDRDKGSNIKLYLASAPSLEGPWTLHPQNPLKTDIAGSRPAGTPYLHDGVLYRPAQDSTRTYGGGIIIHRVRKLSQTEYEEEPAYRLAPEPNGRYSQAFHTLAAAGNLSVVDGKRYVFVAQILPIILAQKIGSAYSRLVRPTSKVGSHERSGASG